MKDWVSEPAMHIENGGVVQHVMKNLLNKLCMNSLVSTSWMLCMRKLHRMFQPGAGLLFSRFFHRFFERWLNQF